MGVGEEPVNHNSTERQTMARSRVVDNGRSSWAICYFGT